MAIDFVAHLRSESARFREVLAAADPAARVPTCPDWDAADLLWHLAEVQHFWGVIVRDKLDDPGSTEEPERPEGYAELLERFDEYSAMLVEGLDGSADDIPVWTWFEADKSVGFVRRRQAHEALIHRIDAELATGEVTHVDSALAADGALEVLEWIYANVPGWATYDLDGPLGRVVVSDTGDAWFVHLGHWSGESPNSGKTYAAMPALSIVESGEPAFEVRGPAVDLDCWLWNRPTRAEVVMDGDVDAFRAMIRSGVQ